MAPLMGVTPRPARVHGPPTGAPVPRARRRLAGAAPLIERPNEES